MDNDAIAVAEPASIGRSFAARPARRLDLDSDHCDGVVVREIRIDGDGANQGARADKYAKWLRSDDLERVALKAGGKEIADRRQVAEDEVRCRGVSRRNHV